MRELNEDGYVPGSILTEELERELIKRSTENGKANKEQDKSAGVPKATAKAPKK